jgi:ABC-type transport system substrate-binding protein
VFKVFHWDSPASMSILEEATYSTVVPMMGVFNNLIMYDQHVPQNSMKSIVPDLATSWSWNEEGTELSFKLRQDIEYTIIPNRSTALLAFEAGKFDMTWPFVVTVPLLKDVKSQAP